MTIRTKLSLNAIVVLTAISVIIVSAMISARTVDRNVSELTQKTAPYQLKALNQQRELQAHAANLISLSTSKTIEDYKKESVVVSASLSAVSKAAEDMAKLKGESSKEDKAISQITRGILDITERRIKAREAVTVSAKSIQERLSEVAKRLDTFVRSLQKKSSGNIASGVDNMVDTNQQLNHLNAVRDGLKDLNLSITKIPASNNKRHVAILRDNALNRIKAINQTLKSVTLKGVETIVKEMNKKLAYLNDKLTEPFGFVSLQLKYLNDEDEAQRDKIDVLAKEAGYVITYLMPLIDKFISSTQRAMMINTSAMAENMSAFKNTNDVLSLASESSLLSASLETEINNFIYAKNINEFNQQVANIESLFKDAGSKGQKLLALVAKMKNTEEMKMVSAFMGSLSTVKNVFSGSGGVSEKVKDSLKNMEELEALNGRMRTITAKQLKESQQEVSQAGANQENVVISLNQASKRTMQIVAVVGGLIIVITLMMAIIITRSITKPINNVVEGLLDSADQVAAASGQVSSASQSLAEGASQQAAGIEETSASIEEMSSMTRQNADNANQANIMMRETDRVVDEANQSMVDLTRSMKDISSASEETAKIIKTIDEIAFQTNLLALNAAVEAARAGEAGAGFAVVADEVRNLALQAAEAAKNTTELIEGTVKKIKSGSDIVTQANEAFARVATGAKKVVELVSEISAASSEQSQGIDQINKAVSEMDRVVQRNAANAEESASASEEMSGQAETMKGFVNQLVTLVGRKRIKGSADDPQEGIPEESGGDEMEYLEAAEESF
jgi:methyl-accepting chemotaxis protein